jgi:hypothetical protein
MSTVQDAVAELFGKEGPPVFGRRLAGCGSESSR